VLAHTRNSHSKSHKEKKGHKARKRKSYMHIDFQAEIVKRSNIDVLILLCRNGNGLMNFV